MDNPLTGLSGTRQGGAMARNHTVELKFQGQPLSSFGAPSCQLDRSRISRLDRDRRVQAELGLPVSWW